MKFLRDIHDQIDPHFQKGGKFEKFFAIWEVHDTAMFTPGTVTRSAPHVRDGMDLKRMMITVVVALLPILAFALYNTGYQGLAAISAGALPLDDVQMAIWQWVGLPFDHENPLLCVIFGSFYFLPIFAITFAAGGLVEISSAIIRGHEVNEGFLVSGFLLPLTLPPTIPLWMVFLGMCFGLIFGKEVFGGTGMNFLNPALVARAFLFFAYPAYMSGDAPWIAANFAVVDNFSGATLAGTGRRAPPGALEAASWSAKAFFGLIPGSMGETSTFLALLGLLVLLITRVGAWQTVTGVVAGTVLLSACTERGRIGVEPDVRDPVLVAHGARRLGLRDGLHGHRPGVLGLHGARQVLLRPRHRRDGHPDPRREPGLSGGDDARDPLHEHVRAPDRPLRRPGEHQAEARTGWSIVRGTSSSSPPRSAVSARSSWRTSAVAAATGRRQQDDRRAEEGAHRRRADGGGRVPPR